MPGKGRTEQECSDHVEEIMTIDTRMGQVADQSRHGGSMGAFRSEP
jgi:hypothetical protein